MMQTEDTDQVLTLGLVLFVLLGGLVAVSAARGGSAGYLLAALALFAFGVVLLAARGNGPDIRRMTSADTAPEAAAAFWLAVAGAFGLALACFDRWRNPGGGPADGGMTPREKRVIAAVAPVGVFLIGIVLVLKVLAEAAGPPPFRLVAVAGAGMIGLAVLHRRLSRWAYPEWWAHRDRLLYPDAHSARPAPAAPPGPRPTNPLPAMLAMIGLAAVAVIGMVVIAIGIASRGFPPLARGAPANDVIGFLFLAAVAIGCGFVALRAVRAASARPDGVPAAAAGDRPPRGPGGAGVVALLWTIVGILLLAAVASAYLAAEGRVSGKVPFFVTVVGTAGTVACVFGVMYAQRKRAAAALPLPQPAAGGGGQPGGPRPAAARAPAAGPGGAAAPPARPLPEVKWPDDERSRAAQRWLAVWVAVAVVVGWLVIFASVIPKAGWGFPSLVLYVVVLSVVVPLVVGLLRWGFRRTPPPDGVTQPVPVVLSVAAQPPADAGGSPRSRNCPKCAAPIAADAPQGLCPKCLMREAFPAVSPLQTAAYTGPFVPPPVEDVAAFFPHLEILGLVGQGGMGAVYKARQPALDRVVALKLIRPHEDDPTFAERFAREAKALAKLGHPNIVTVHEFGEAGGSQYLLMEFVDGVTLRDAMRAKSLTPPVALKVIGQICDALQFAHAKGVVHRDIKPENILLAKDGAVKIADFGLAKVVDPSGVSLTRSHQAMGTPHYMAPEQWEKPAEVDHRADIYALGVVLYELLTGELPLGRFDPPSQKVQIDVRIDEVVLKALAKEPGRRYQAVVNVRTDLEAIGRHPYRPPAGHRLPPLREYKSKATVFGWPLVHVVNGIDPVTGRQPWAKGVIAIGPKAIGGLAVGGFAVGGVAVGGFAVGVLAVAGMAFGAFALGGMAVGLVAAGGGMAVAGLFAAGGSATGYFAAGGQALGVHTLDGASGDPAAFWQAVRDFFSPLTVPPPATAPAMKWQ